MVAQKYRQTWFRDSDGQEESFYCLEMKKLMDIKGNYSQIFGWTFPSELVKTVYNIHTFREEYRKLG